MWTLIEDIIPLGIQNSQTLFPVFCDYAPAFFTISPARLPWWLIFLGIFSKVFLEWLLSLLYPLYSSSSWLLEPVLYLAQRNYYKNFSGFWISWRCRLWPPQVNHLLSDGWSWLGGFECLKGWFQNLLVFLIAWNMRLLFLFLATEIIKAIRLITSQGHLSNKNLPKKLCWKAVLAAAISNSLCCSSNLDVSKVK